MRATKSDVWRPTHATRSDTWQPTQATGRDAWRGLLEVMCDQPHTLLEAMRDNPRRLLATMCDNRHTLQEAMCVNPHILLDVWQPPHEEALLDNTRRPWIEVLTTQMTAAKKTNQYQLHCNLRNIYSQCHCPKYRVLTIIYIYKK